MKITTARRISQAFFFIITVWFCAVTASGTEWWQLRGWPVNWIIELDPLAGLGILLATHSIYSGLIWSLVTIVLTILLGRFFCGWLCPFGTLHQFTGYIANREKTPAKKAEKNSYKSAQILKYIFLIFLLTAAIPDLLVFISGFSTAKPVIFWVLVAIIIILLIILSVFEIFTKPKKIIISFLLASVFIALLSVLPQTSRILSSSLQTGLLDPIPLFYRSVNLIFIPLLDGSLFSLSKIPRFYEGTWLIGAVFLAAVLMNLYIPRFYCRFICPLGALFGLLGRYAIWRIGKSEDKCPDCLMCEKDCEGACSPSSKIRASECVLCMNCLHTCPHDLIGYRTQISASGETATPDLTKRRLVGSVLSGIIAVPMIRLNGSAVKTQNPRLIRPPGAVDEPAFLSRCIKCGQCMKVCPTNVIQPGLSEAGIEGLWSPVLDFKIGTSGCQLNCIACGHICPTSAIRPLRLDEKTGKNEFSSAGPIRIGTAFVDHGRCLPWAMDKPCIVCQENCPVSPKAILTKEAFSFTGKQSVINNSDSSHINIEQAGFIPDSLATGDYYCKISGNDETMRLITGNSENSIKISPSIPLKPPPSPGSRIEIYIRLQRPFIEPARCTGCGICEHECPVRSIRAIRVTSDNESRNKTAAMVL
ncbi:MAG: 4Fe-4S binding protein [Desulfobacteraceae bacterium]|nr:MAG: 4Fe-4S binding protein [Desulfobacteraceae bacterium]